MKVRRSKKVMENFVCPSCWNQIQSCTCQNYPPYHLVMIDVNIQDAIRILNQKGYQTIGCCESHFGDSCSIYVAFPFDQGFSNIPDGFSYTKQKTIVSYAFNKNERENEELYKIVKEEKLKTLHEWVESLPDNPKCFRRQSG